LTAASAGVPNFEAVLQGVAARSPLLRNVTLENLSGTGIFYLSDLSAGTTGENTHVDCGFSVGA
jgi:enoyl-[acyl-carrier protein] reductase I